MSTAGVKDFKGAMINRFFLGCLEAAVTSVVGEYIRISHANIGIKKSRLHIDDWHVVSE
jgi:hypothetical protein